MVNSLMSVLEFNNKHKMNVPVEKSTSCITSFYVKLWITQLEFLLVYLSYFYSPGFCFELNQSSVIIEYQFIAAANPTFLLFFWLEDKNENLQNDNSVFYSNIDIKLNIPNIIYELSLFQKLKRYKNRRRIQEANIAESIIC